AQKIKVPSFLKKAPKFSPTVTAAKGAIKKAAKAAKPGFGARIESFEKAHPRVRNARVGAELGLGLGTPAALGVWGAHSIHKGVKDEIAKTRNGVKNEFQK